MKQESRIGNTAKKKQLWTEKVISFFETHTNMFVVALSNVKNSLSYFVYITHV